MNKDSDVINLKQLGLNIIVKWNVILLSGIVAGAIAGVYAVFIAKPVYIASAQFIPTKGSGEGQMSAAAALIGAKPPSNDVELFQSILVSRRVINRFMMMQIPDSTGRANTPLFKLLHVDTANRIEFDDVVESITNSINVEADAKSRANVINVMYSARSPWLAKSGGDALVKCALDVFSEIKDQRYSTSMEKLEVAIDETYKEWLHASSLLAAFNDRNRSIALANQMLNLSKLEMEKAVKEQKYLLARKEYEEINLNSLKASVPIIMIDSMNYPRRKTKPNRRLLIAAGFFSGIIISTFFYAIKHGDSGV
ncbi:MAG: hypothetical protein IPP74_15035 [Alphaproteobacteria bacterium]|nr:hypothetical protein [Alphaproteobacteria bacterium]